MSHRVVTYNLLSSRLARPDYFTSCRPEDLDAGVRLPKILAALQGEVEREAILCLQEVSTEWVGELHKFFAGHNYHLMTALYGGRKSGYMGVAMAIPRERYILDQVVIERLSDTRTWSRLSHWTVVLRNGLHALVRMVRAGFQVEHPQTFARRRYNQHIFVRLRDRQTLESFCVGNYHMPCLFFVAQVMTIHLGMLMQRMCVLANADPLIVTGDFNIRPRTPHYDFLVSGHLPADAPEYPALLPGDPWRPDLPHGFASAYAQALGEEPAFTNYSMIKDHDPFCDTLDYIWLSREWSTVSVRPLPTLDQVGSPLPNAHYPSDHLLLAAEVAMAPGSI
ncbi:MAG TPA: endonuclease/exonuclease/phosphatase family protein [Kiritimatiellia bacterium]|mgnify:CR=1 FL=1|nr:endonuclease/exonuclease/phosphatase family protein [Kiritimatiellia bacterium]